MSHRITIGRYGDGCRVCGSWCKVFDYVDPQASYEEDINISGFRKGTDQFNKISTIVKSFEGGRIVYETIYIMHHLSRRIIIYD